MDVMGIREEELTDGAELGGVSAFPGSGERSDIGSGREKAYCKERKPVNPLISSE